MRISRLILAAVLPAVALCSVGCAPLTGRPPLPPRQRPRPPISAQELEKRIHRLVNQERARYGLSPLAWNEALSRIARKHSRDMGDRNYFSHQAPEGSDFSDRYRRNGFTCAVREGTTVHMGGENIFRNNLYDSVTTVDGKAYFDWNSEEKIARTTVEGWMDSPGHRRNILTPHWRTEGIGIYITPDDRVFITQNFC